MDTFLRRLVHPLYKSLETRLHPLRYLFLEITQRCNLSCLHCGSDCGRTAQLPELTPRQWMDFLEKVAADFAKKNLILVITGGEPLCAPGFFEILAKIRSLGLTWGMVSNGYGLTPKVIDRLLTHNLSSVTVSIDGLETAHNRLRARRDSFQRAVKAVATLAHTGIPFVDVVTCVHPGNLGDLDGLKGLLVSLGVKYWRLFTITPKGRALRHPELLLSGRWVQDLLDWIARQRAAESSIDINFSCEGYLPRDVDAQVRDQPYFCRAGINIGSVLCDGSISACPNISRSLVQGNILTDDFRAVWNNRFQRFRDRSWMWTGRCQTCPQWKSCLGNSLHLWDDEKGETAFCHYGLYATCPSASRTDPART